MAFEFVFSQRPCGWDTDALAKVFNWSKYRWLFSKSRRVILGMRALAYCDSSSTILIQHDFGLFPTTHQGGTDNVVGIDRMGRPVPSGTHCCACCSSRGPVSRRPFARLGERSSYCARWRKGTGAVHRAVYEACASRRVATSACSARSGSRGLAPSDSAMTSSSI